VRAKTKGAIMLTIQLENEVETTVKQLARQAQMQPEQLAEQLVLNYVYATLANETELWANEALRREQEIINGSSVLVSGDEAVARIRARLI
jgi:hypothetical protein